MCQDGSLPCHNVVVNVDDEQFMIASSCILQRQSIYHSIYVIILHRKLIALYVTRTCGAHLLYDGIVSQRENQCVVHSHSVVSDECSIQCELVHPCGCTVRDQNEVVLQVCKTSFVCLCMRYKCIFYAGLLMPALFTNMRVLMYLHVVCAAAGGAQACISRHTTTTFQDSITDN